MTLFWKFQQQGAQVTMHETQCKICATVLEYVPKKHTTLS